MPAWLERMLPFERYRVDLGDRRMHVMEAGRGTPVLMLHGNPTWGFLYRRVAAALDLSRFRIILPDLIGLGLSDKPRAAAAHTLDAHIAWLGRLIDALGLEQVIFVGQDWGGPIGFGALAQRPGSVAGLVVLNTVIGPPKPGFRPTLFHRFAHLPVLSDLAFRLLAFPQAGLALAQGDRRSIRGDVARAYRYPLRDPRDNVAALALARMVPDSLSHASIPALQRVFSFVSGYTGPAAIVWGERDPVLGRVRSHVERTLPHARVTRTPAGHFLQEEVPEVIAAAIVEVAAGGT